MGEQFNVNSELQIIPLLATGAFPGTPAGYRFGMSQANDDSGSAGGFQESPEINSSYEPTEPAWTPGEPKATFTTAVRKSMIGWLLKYHIGNPTDSGGTPDFINTFDIGALDPCCLEFWYKDVSQAHRYGGGVGLMAYLTKMSWSYTQGAILVTPCEVWGPFAQDTSQKDSTPTDYADVITSVSNMVTLKKDTVAWTGKVISLDYTSDRGPSYLPGGLDETTKTLTTGPMKITGNMTIKFEDDTIRGLSLAGTAVDLEIITTWTAGHHTLSARIQELKLGNVTFGIGGQAGRVTMSAPFQGYYSSGAVGTALRYVLTNGVEHYATPVA